MHPAEQSPAVGTAVEGAAVGVEEVMAGAVASVETATPLTTAQTVSQTAKAALRYGFYGGLQSAGTSGLQYDIQHGRDFSWGDFFKVMGEGFMTGAIKGGINGGVASSSAAIGLLKGRSITASVGLRAMMKAGTSMVGSDLSVLLSDAVTGQKVTPKQLLLASVKGAAIGTVTGAFSGVKAIDPSTTAVKGVEKHLVKASNLINKTANTAKALAKSEDAKGVYITAGTLSAGLYAVWTTFENI
ncbi:MAG: hypothetical protein IT497_02195 [Ottowia sp.]|nr:hypothetical protein [Ottowia sp.]